MRSEIDVAQVELLSAVKVFLAAPTLDHMRAMEDAAWNLHDVANDAELVEVMATPVEEREDL